MTAVTANTNMDKPKMVFAAVDAGAKMLGELAKRNPGMHVTHYFKAGACSNTLPGSVEI